MFFKKPKRKNLSEDLIIELKKYIDQILEAEQAFYAALDDFAVP